MTLFPTRILLATDGSEEADLAARTAVGLAAAADAELHVVYVRPLPEFMKNGDGQAGFDRELYEKIEAESRQKLRKLTWGVKVAGGIVAGSHLRMGGVAKELVDLVEKLGADLLVVGSRGRGGIRRAVAGSVSDWVVRHARCPVLVVRSPKNADDRARSWLGSLLARFEASKKTSARR